MGAPDPRNVWVVHGRDHAAKDAVFAFLKGLRLRPLEWDDVAAATGKASPSIDEVVRQGFRSAHAVVVLLTPDDEARLRRPFRSSDDSAAESLLSGQPRPNVLYEAGMAMGLHAERTILVEFGQTRVASDLLGFDRVRLQPSPTSLQKLAKRLKSTGCPVPNLRPDRFEKLAAKFPDPARFAAQVELLVTVPKGSVTDGQHVYVAGEFHKLSGGDPEWEPIDMEADDAEHWRLTLAGRHRDALEYKYLLRPPDTWEVYRGDALRNRTLTLRREKRSQHDVVERWSD